MEEIMNDSNQYKIKELIVEKIKLKEKPLMRKFLREFFQNPKKYFNNQFNNKKVIIGKVKSINEKFEVPIPKKYQRKINNKRRTRTYKIDNETLSEQLSLFNEKRKGFKGMIDSSLKEGQRYINDRELEEIFKTFQKVHEINKTKITDFVSTKDLVESMYTHNIEELIKEKNNNKNNKNNKLNNLLRTNSSNLSSVNNDLNNSHTTLQQENNNKISNKNSPSRLNIYSSQEKYNSNIVNKKIPKIKLQNKPFPNTLNDFLLKKTNSIENNISIRSQNDSFSNWKPNSAFKKLTNSSKLKEKQKAKTYLLENEKLLEKQTQFLPETNQQLIIKEMAKRLASQEKAILYNNKVKNKETNLLDFLSKKLRKQKSALLLGQIEDYRIVKDIKIKLNRIIKKSTPGHNYVWERDLRNEKNEDEGDTPRLINNDYNKKISLSQNDEITRNPSYKTFYAFDKKFRNKEREYLKSRVSKKLYNKFMNDLNDLKKNYDGFLIEGQNLLRCEHDLVKKIKGKKIINKYEFNLQPQDINNELYAKNFYITKFNKS